MQLCPYCELWVGSLVDHIKTAHSDRNSRQIKTQCPYEGCTKVVVDIKNHIKFVHVRDKRFECDKCHSCFISNHQLVMCKESVKIDWIKTHLHTSTYYGMAILCTGY